ncbi:MAG: hypothetical protein JEY79_11015 [Pseudodesulfovibrio sp.]|nr:hypothetical protein [Pseudodesulfovibrio sp.]
MPRNLKDPTQYDTITEIIHDLIKFAPSGNSARRIAALSNMPYSTLMNGLNQSESNAGCRFPVESMDSIVSAAGGESFMARYFAAKAGGLFVQLPKVEGTDACRKQFMASMGELGALVRSFEHARHEDGPGGKAVRPDELEKFEAQAQSALTQLQLAVLACRLELQRAEEA